MDKTIHDAKAVFFDWDGTLVDSFLFLHKAHNYVRGVLGIELFSVEEFSGYFGQPREKLYTKLYGDKREEAKKHFEAFVYENHAKELKPIDGAKEVLDWFKNKNIPCAIVTNKKAELVKAEISAFGWDDYFITIVGAGEAPEDKPSAAPLLLAIERSQLDLKLEDIWYVGDTDNDLGCSNKAGTKTLFIADNELYSRVSGNYIIDLHVPSVESFYDLLLQNDRNTLKANTGG